MTDYTKGSSVAIILLNWNGFEFAKACIDSLLQDPYKEAKIFLVDNGSVDGSLEKLSVIFPEVCFIDAQENLGFSGGNNLGIQFALQQGFDYMLLLNNDTVVTKDFLVPMVEHLESLPNCAAVQPLIYYLANPKKLWNAGGKYIKWLAKSKTSFTIQSYSQPYPTDWITGCAILVKASVVKKVGMLDNTYFAYYEDVDWSLRMRKSGYNLYVVPRSKIFHEGGSSSKSKAEGKEGILDPKVHYLNVRNQVFQLRKYATLPYGLTAWPYQLSKFIIYVGYFFIRGRWVKLKAVIRGLFDGLKFELKEQG